ncbi:MAG: hypothetical protein R6U04_00860 [Bacteroidales bacterium]
MGFLKRHFLYALIVAFSLWMLYSCSEEERNGRITEGYIVYDIEYLDDSLNSLVKSFFPKEMVIKFKNNSVKNQMVGFSDFFSFAHIKKSDDKINTTLLTLMDKKYRYTEKLNGSSIFFKDRPDIQIKYTDEEKEIAGFHCKKIKIILPKQQEDSEKFSIFYTDSIIIDGFNSHTLFRSIDGVLMEFQLDFYDIPMKLTATEVRETEISSEEFEIPDEYRQINKKTMEEIIALLK